MKFACKGYTKSGDPVTEVIEASDATDAAERLRRRGVFVVSTAPANAGDAPAAKSKESKGKSNLKHLAIFAREMSVLVSTGTPVVEALMAMERQAKDDGWKETLHDVRRRVEEGSPLSEAMHAHPVVFDAVAKSLVAAGESSGQLDKMLDRLAALTRRQMQARSAIIGALIYPALLLVVATVVITLMTVFVLPRFGGLFKTLDTPLPPTTKVLMDLSAFLRGYWWAVIPGIFCSGVGAWAWTRTPSGRRCRETVALRAPRFGVLVRSFATARIARILGVLLESRVPLIECLALTKASMTNSLYRDLIAKAEERVTKGDAVSAAFTDSDLVAPSVCEAMRNGEQTGRLGQVLLSVADYLDDENQAITKSLSTLLEPVIMISLGLVVGFIAISMFLPLFDLTAAAGGGAP